MRRFFTFLNLVRDLGNKGFFNDKFEIYNVGFKGFFISVRGKVIIGV